MKGLAVLMLALHASNAARTPGEVVRFGFPYKSCKDGEFEDGQSGSRKLTLGTGGNCSEGPFGNHLGVVLYDTPIGVEYKPLESAQGDFAAEFTDGFTLELWVKPQPLDDTADRVIVSLSAPGAKSFTHADMQTLNCTQDDVSFQLIMKPSGCLVVRAKFISTKDCLASLAYEREENPDIAERESTFTLPHETQCATSKYSSNPDDPGLDLTTPKLQHVVVSLSAYMGGEAGNGADRGEPPDQAGTKRFAVWVDSELKTSDEHLDDKGLPAMHERLWNNFLRFGAVIAMKRTDDDYDLTTDKTKNFEPSAIWGADHALRVGFDGTSDSPRFEGEVLWVRVRGS